MKTNFPRKNTVRLLILLALALLTLLAVGCKKDGECTHFRTVDSTHEPDCSHQGYVLHECRDCDYSYKSDFVQPYGHTFSIKTTDPTCTEQGATTYTCSTCDYTFSTDYIAPIGHKLVTTVTEPTCVESGYTTYTCERNCGYTYASDTVAPKGHTLLAAAYAATCTEGAYTRYMCSACDFGYHSAISSPLGHSFTHTVVRPAIARTGYTEHTCHCGYSYRDHYVWYSDIFSGAEGDSTKIFSKGIDLSYWNEEIDWAKLKSTGIDYVILRAAYYPKGSKTVKIDPKFNEYYAAARAQGFDIGCYLYSMATTAKEAAEEAEILIDIIDGKTFEYPVYFDLEDPSLEWVTTDTLMNISLAFCQAMIDGGYFPGVYTNNKWLVNSWDQEQLCALYDIWYARYPKDDDGETLFKYGQWTDTTYAGLYGMWQYTEFGLIDGVKDKVDLNLCYKDYPSLIKKYGFNGFEAE